MQNEQKRAKTSKNEQLFFCEKCDYSTSRKSNYDRHLVSIKHLEKKGVLLKSGKNRPKKMFSKFVNM